MKHKNQLVWTSLLFLAIGCFSSPSNASQSSFSKKDCDMDLPTHVWYAAFNKGRFSQAELIIGTTIAVNMNAGFELVEKDLRGQSKNVLDVGAGAFKGKRIPACLEKVDLNFVNRSKGERKKECFAIAYTNDNEFDMHRAISVMKCEVIETEMPKWIKANNITGMKFKALEAPPALSPTAAAPAVAAPTVSSPSPSPPSVSAAAAAVQSPARVASAANAAAIDGNWYSKEWRYGYALRNGVGKATSTNSPNFQVGQEIVFLEPSGDGVFRGRQVYTDGKFYAVTAVLQPNGELHFSGERNVRWVMRRID